MGSCKGKTFRFYKHKPSMKYIYMPYIIKLGVRTSFFWQANGNLIYKTTIVNQKVFGSTIYIYGTFYLLVAQLLTQCWWWKRVALHLMGMNLHLVHFSSLPSLVIALVFQTHCWVGHLHLVPPISMHTRFKLQHFSTRLGYTWWLAKKKKILFSNSLKT